MNRTVVVPRGPRLTGAAWDAALGGLPEGERRRVAAYRHWENQQDSVLATPGPRQRERFFLLWTAKEAYVKATGVGIQTDLRHVVIDHSGDEPRLAGSERDQWRFTVTSPAPQVWVTVCSERTA